MKTIRSTKKLKLKYLLWMTLLLIFTACQEDDVMTDPKEPESENTDPETILGDPNKATENLQFVNKVIHQGDIPGTASGIVTDPPLADLKINVDTLFLTQGLVANIKILKPLNLGYALQILHIQVEGSDQYIETTLNDEIENDSIDLFEIAFDPIGWDLSTSFNLKLVFLNDAMQAIDEFDVPVVIEAPIDYNGLGACDFQEQLFKRDSTMALRARWEWVKTLVFNGNDLIDILAPNFDQFSTGKAGGCCGTNGSYISPNCTQTADFREVEYEYGSIYYDDYIEFFEDGTVSGGVGYTTQNINQDPDDTNYCSGEVAYSWDSGYRYYAPGNYSFKSLEFYPPLSLSSSDDYTFYDIRTNLKIPSCALAIDKLEGIGFPIPVTAGSGTLTEYFLISKNWLGETVRQAEGNRYRFRYYQRPNIPYWRD